MNMCTHNARGRPTDLRSFSETERVWIFPNSLLPSYGGNPYTRCAQLSGQGGGGGGESRGLHKKKLQKRPQMVGSGGIRG